MGTGESIFAGQSQVALPFSIGAQNDPRKSSGLACPHPKEGNLRKGAGRRSGRVSPAGICLDLKTIAPPEHKPGEPRGGVPSHWPGVRRTPGGLRSPLPRWVGGEGKEREERQEAAVDATLVPAYVLPDPKHGGRSRLRSGQPQALLWLEKSSVARLLLTSRVPGPATPPLANGR